MEEDNKIEEPRIRIENVSQLSKEKAIKLKERGIKKVVILRKFLYNKREREKFNREFFLSESDMHTYDIDTYIAILDKLYELTEGVTKDMPEDEDERFAIIYERVCKSIEYDHEATVKNGTPEEEEYKKKVEDTSKNLQNGLLEGKCVCGGYAEILRHALALCGIECEHIGNEKHAWNKVKLHGVWFNADATNDRYYLIRGERPQHVFKSDEDLIKEDKDKIYGEEFEGPECFITEPDYVLDDLFHIKVETLPEMILQTYKEMGEDIIKYVAERKKDYISDVKSSGIRVALVNLATTMVKDFMKEMEESKDELKDVAEFIKDETKKGKERIIKGVKKIIPQRFTKSKNKEQKLEAERDEI